MEVQCTIGCLQMIKYDDFHNHEETWDGLPKIQPEEEKKELDNERFKNILFILDRDKPEILRFDTITNSRIKISVTFTSDPLIPFPSFFQFWFFRPINRMFVVGGSNFNKSKVENWNVLQVI